MIKFVTAIDGARDFYELPLALHERKLLERHVSDSYVPDSLMPFVSKFKSRLKNRHREGLPSSRVAVAPDVALIHALQRRNILPDRGHDAHFEISRRLSLRAARIARRRDAALFLYSEHAFWAFEELPDRPRLMFQFHPHFASVYDLLVRDVDQHPEVRCSFEHEGDSQPPNSHSPERLEEWRLADRIACASSFTKRSLVEQGCDGARIDVVPYGADRLVHREINYPRGEACRFLFVGQGVQRKGLHHLLKAWRFLSPSPATLTVVARRLDPGIESLLDQRGVTYRAGVSDEELPELLAMSDVFVMPSLIEGFGLVYTEALNAGLLTIGTANTGLPDLDLPGDVAMIARPGDVEDLSRVMAEALDLWMRKEIDRTRIARSIGAHSWARFRAKLGDFAARALEADPRPR